MTHAYILFLDTYNICSIYHISFISRIFLRQRFKLQSKRFTKTGFQTDTFEVTLWLADARSVDLIGWEHCLARIKPNLSYPIMNDRIVFMKAKDNLKPYQLGKIPLNQTGQNFHYNFFSSNSCNLVTGCDKRSRDWFKKRQRRLHTMQKGYWQFVYPRFLPRIERNLIAPLDMLYAKMITSILTWHYLIVKWLLMRLNFIARIWTRLFVSIKIQQLTTACNRLKQFLDY